MIRFLLAGLAIVMAGAVIAEDVIGHDGTWAKAALATIIGLLVGQHIEKPTP